MIKQSLQLKIGQQLTLTPQLQQAIRLLQLSTLELQVEIQQSLEGNPMLELEEENNDASEAELQSALDALKKENPDLSVDLTKEKLSEELPVDSVWEDVYQSATLPKSNVLPEAQSQDIQNSQVMELREYLQWQMQLTPFSETDKAIAMIIIDSISDEGFFVGELEDIIKYFPSDQDLELDEIQTVLHRIQQFDPPGIGARDINECLLIQLNQMPNNRPWVVEAKQVITKHMHLLVSRDYSKLMRVNKLNEKQLKAVISLIQSLNPRPGNAIAPSKAEYVVPDVIVNKKNGRWVVELNSEVTPRLRINDDYASLVVRADTSPDNNFLRNHLQEARWFLKSLQSRNETLLKVASCIVEHQREFLESGEEAMKPLVLHDVAEAIGMHESTISRVTTEKYLHTPRGVYELKFFFSSHVGTCNGGECSSTAIRALIKKLIANESSLKPLSDSKIANILQDRGINIARRTIAKYRESMGVLPSNERKNLV